MKVELVLLIVGIAFVNGSQNSDSTDISTQSDHVTHSSVDEKQRMNVFPKHTQRFTVTMKSIKARTYSTPNNKPTQRAIKFKIMQAASKIRNVNYWKTVSTRRPLMRHIQFTMKPLSTFKVTENSKIERKHKSITFNKMGNGTENNGSSEEIPNKSKIRKQDKQIYFRTTTRPLHKMRFNVTDKKEIDDISKSKESDNTSHIEVTTPYTKVNESEFSSEELEDREEFIFVQPQKPKQNNVKVIKDGSSESEETATEMEEETKIRKRRSINVIEEENLGTTVSGFKFTGKVALLSNDLMFRNINT